MNITKGTWYAVENDYYIDIKVNGNPIAQVTENEFVGTDKDTMRANAKLMECAPEMYAEIEKDIAWLARMIVTHGADHPMTPVFADMKQDKISLLAKAGGGNA